MAWSAALLAHYDDRMHWAKAPEITVSVVMCLFGLFFARSSLIMLAVAIAQILAWWHHMPSIDNHWAFSAAVNMALVVSLVRRWAIDRFRFRALDQDWYDRVAPMLRLLVVTMYAFAVFHKLNWGFLDHETSCAMHFFRRIGRTPYSIDVPSDVPVVWKTFIVYGVLALEGSIALGLMFRRTWMLGIIAGVTFHLTTALFMRHFPMIMFALYFLFIPKEVQSRMLSFFERVARKCTAGRHGLVELFVFQALLFSATSMLIHEYMGATGIGRRDPQSGYYVMLRVWQLGATVTFAVLVVAVFLRREALQASIKGHLRPRSWLQCVVPLLFFLNCMAPYFGFKTATSVAMWSNLITTGGVSNHLLIPQGTLEVFDYASDVVEIKTTNDRKLRKLARKRRLVPFYEFQSELRRAKRRTKPLRVTYVRDGKLIVVPDVSEHRELTARRPYWFRKLVKVKGLRKDYKPVCVW